MSRRFVTRSTVEAALARGETTMELSGAVTVTDEAAARARERGLVFVRDGVVVAGRPTPASQVTPLGPESHGEPGTHEGTLDRASVRRAVVAVLGHVPAELDTVLDKVLGPAQHGR